MEAPKCFKCGERHWSGQKCKVAVTKKSALTKALDVLVPAGWIRPDGLIDPPVKERGRKKKYASPAARQRAYRARKEKASGTVEGS